MVPEVIDQSTKLTLNTPDDVCRLCSQLWEGQCRAYSASQSDAEKEARAVGTGPECDSDELKQDRMRRLGVMYNVPPVE